MRHRSSSLLALVLRGAASMAAPKTPQSLLRPQKGSDITFEDIARIPRPGSQGVAKAAFSPDGSHLTYLKSGDGSLTTQLYATDVKTGTTFLAFGSETNEDSFTLSKEEQMRRERARVMATGVTTYAWAKNADVLLVPADGALFVKQGIEGAATKLFDVDAFPDVGQGPPLDAKLSEDGKRVVFVWADEVLIPASPFVIKVDEKNTHDYTLRLLNCS